MPLKSSGKKKFLLSELIVLTDDEDDSNNTQEQNYAQFPCKSTMTNRQNKLYEKTLKKSDKKSKKNTKKSKKNDKKCKNSSESEDYYDSEESLSVFINPDRVEKMSDEEMEEEKLSDEDDEDDEVEICSKCKMSGDNLFSCKTCPDMFHRLCLDDFDNFIGNRLEWKCKKCLLNLRYRQERNELKISNIAVKNIKDGECDVVDSFPILSFPEPPQSVLFEVALKRGALATKFK